MTLKSEIEEAMASNRTDENKRKWSKTLPRKSGWFWVKTGTDHAPSIMQVEGRDADTNGWVWMDESERLYLTEGIMDESGDDEQSNEWMEWQWAGPIAQPVDFEKEQAK